MGAEEFMAVKKGWRMENEVTVGKRKATLLDWFLLMRPWSITAPLIPFLVGWGIAHGNQLGLEGDSISALGGSLRWLLALVSGVLLVFACNLFNTWGDERSGVDRIPGAFLTTPQIQEGKITLRETFVFGCVLFVLAGLIGLTTLLYREQMDPTDNGFALWFGDRVRFNWALFGGAVIGFLGAVNYSTGIKYKYYGLGVPFVAFLQGPLYIFVVLALLAPQLMNLTLSHLPRMFLLSLPVASLVGVILHGNDMRDIATDRRAGIATLAGKLGPKGALVVFFILHLIPYLVLLYSLYLFVGISFHFGVGMAVKETGRMFLPLLALPLTVRLLCTAAVEYRANPASPSWRTLEKGSGAIHFIFGVLYALMLVKIY